MNDSLIQTILAAGNGVGENTFWIQILVLLVLVAFWGLYSLAKNRPNKFRDRQQRLVEETGPGRTKAGRQFRLLRKHIGWGKGIARKTIQVGSRQVAQEAIGGFDNPDIAGQEKPRSEPAGQKVRDLRSGMELLELDFLLSVVENTSGDDGTDVIMRKFNFKELLRRGKLDQINSNALKVYAINQGNLYDKDIQCGAIRELAERTAQRGKRITAEGAKTGQ